MKAARELRALAIRQPFSWAVCAGVKTVENRTWSTTHRGTIAVHASTDHRTVLAFRRETECEVFTREWFTFGAIIGLVDVVDVESYGPSHESDPFACGPYCWKLANGRFLREPIPFKGKLNLFKLPLALQNQILTAETYVLDVDRDPEAKAVAIAMPGDPDPVESYLGLIEEYSLTRNHRDALPIAGKRLRELSPDNPNGYLIRGLMGSVEGPSLEPLEDFRKAAQLDPDSFDAWSLLADEYLRRQLHQDAAAAAAELIRILPDDALGYDRRAAAFLGMDELDKAIKDSDVAVKLDPNDAEIRANRAVIQFFSGSETEAFENIDEAIRLQPEQSTWKLLRADFVEESERRASKSE